MNTENKTIETKLPNYRIYDRTGGGVTQDIYAECLDDAIEQGREIIEEGDEFHVRDDIWIERLSEWGQPLLACDVGEFRRKLTPIDPLMQSPVLNPSQFGAPVGAQDAPSDSHPVSASTQPTTIEVIERLTI